ncbi:hypothetical protein [Actinoplanes auranticolor]|uniref:Uncharacterized protein n=1 Tax=Actinoplanes auranticolor TaxID=47988 RepID=A0A919SA15_9ACTN|nr:hypothetical protein [Actinoplanes auranticolor]GIM67076.1 hypothetical protein Aau02nite_25810 [Actinoplanes auranticolor]
MHARADAIRHLRVARAYRNLLSDNGFREAELKVHTMVFTEASTLPLLAGHAAAACNTAAISDEKAEAWIGEQARRAAEGRLMLAVPMFLAAATRW